MRFRSSVVPTRPRIGHASFIPQKGWITALRAALTALALIAFSALAFAGNPTIAIVSGNNQSGPTNTLLPDPLTVQYNDTAGSPIIGGSLIYEVTSGNAVFESNGSTQAFVSTDNLGRAGARVILGSAPGSVVVSVRDFGSTTPVDFTLTAAAPNNSITVISGDNQQANFGQAFAQPLIVELRDGQGMLPIGVRVTFEITRGSATFTNGQFSFSATTGKVGRVEASLIAGDQQGRVSIRIRADGYTDAAASAFVSNFGANPSVRFTDGEFQETSVNSPFPMPLVATVDDGVPRSAEKGNAAGTNGTIPDVPVTFTVLTGNAVFSANGQSSITVNSDAGGQASVFVDATSPEGEVVIEAAAETFSGDRTQGLRILGADGIIQVQGGNGQAVAPGDTTPKPLVAMVQDSAAQPVAGVTVTYRVLDLGLTPPVGITVEPASGVSDSGGLVDFVVNTTTKTPNGAFTVEAAAPGYSPAYFSLRVSDKAGFVSFDITRGNNQSGPTNNALPVPFEVQALDTGDGINPLRNVVVTFDVSSGPASIEGGSGKPVQTFQVLTDANGFARAMVTPDDPGGPFQVTATANIFDTDYVEVFDGSGIAAAPPTLTIVSGDGQSGQPNTFLADPIVAEFRDSAGVPIVKGVVHFRINSGDALLQPVGGSNPSTLVQVTTDSLGRAAVEMVLGATPGPVQAEAGGDPDFVVNAPFGASIVAAPPTLTIVSGDAQSGLPNSTSANPLIAEYRDGNGNVVAGHRLVVEITSANAQVQEHPSGSPATSIVVFTDGSGQVLADILFGPTPGAVTGRVLDPAPVGQNGTQGVFGLAAPAPFTATITAAPSTLTITGGNNQSAPPNTTLPDPLSVQLLDGAGAPVNGASVVYTVTVGDASFSNGQTTFFTNANATGDAAATLTFGPSEGAVTVTAGADGESVTFNVTSVVPNVAPTITYNPPAGSAFALSADGASAFGNISATPSGGSGSGSFATTTVGNCSFATNSASFAVTGEPLTFEGGTKTSGTLSLSCQVGPGDVTARLTCTETRGIAAEPVPVFFDVTCPAAAAPPTLTIVSGDAQSGLPNTTSANPLVAEYRDGNGKPVAGHQLIVEVTSGNAQVRENPAGSAATSIVVVTDGNGQIRADILFGATPGAVSGRVIDPPPAGTNAKGVFGTAPPTPFTATIVAPVPTITVTGGDAQSGPPNTTAPKPLAAQYRDGAGNPVAGQQLLVEITSGNAQVRGRPSGTPGSFIVVATDSMGQVLVDILFGATPGAVTGSISEFRPRGQNGLQGLPAPAAPAPFTATITAAPSTLTITGGNNQSAPPNTTLPDPLSVRLLDGAGAPVSGASVFYAVTGGSATFSNGQTTFVTSTNATGDAAATLTFGPAQGPVTVTADADGQSVTFNLTSVIPNVAPTITYNPPAGSAFALSASGTTASGSIAATPSGGSGTGPGATTTVSNCSFATNSASFTVSGQPLTFVGNTTQAQTLSLTCQLGPAPVTARLTCLEQQGSAQPLPRNFDVTCPAAPTLTITGGNNQSAPTNTTLPDPLTVRLIDSAGAPISGASVFYSVTSGDARFSNGQTTFVTSTNATGDASAMLTFGPNAGPVTVVVNSSGQSVTFNETAIQRTITIVSGNNQSGNPGTTSAPLRVQLSPVIRSEPVTFRLLSGSGALLDANGNPTNQIVITTDPAGTASVVFRYGNTAGPVRIEANAPGYGSVVFDLAVLGQPPNDVFRIVSGNGQSGAPGTQSAPLVVEFLRNGSPAAGETINWFVRSGDAQVENFATTIGSDGRSSNRITFGQTLGPIVLEARTGDGFGSVQFNLTTVAPSSLDIRLLSGGGQSGPINSPFASPLVFEVSNAQGQPQSGVLVSFAVTRGSATLDINSATTDAAGRVSVGGRYGPNAGPIDVRASIGSGTAERSAIATLTSFAPGLNIVSGNNQSGPPGTALPAPLVVEVTRPAGFTGSLAGFVLRWTVIEGGGAVSSATTTTDAAGRASNALTLGAQPGANRVRVDADGGGSVTFLATAGAASAPAIRLEIVSGNNQDLPTNTDSLPLVVRVVDVSTGAPRPNSCVAFSSPTPGVTLSLSQVGSDANGLAQVIARLNDVGPAIVTAQGCTSGAVGQAVFALNGAIENTLGLDPNDRTFGIAQAFDNACFALRSLQAGGATLNAGQADLLARCDDFEFNSGGNPDEVIEALEQILGDEAEAQNNAAFNVAAAQFDNLKARIAALRSGTNGSSFGGLALQGGNGSVPLSFASTVLNATETAAAPAEVGSDFDRWGFFATGTIGDGDRDPEGGSSGFDFETRGLTAGVDYRYSDSLIFGAALGYASNDTQIGANRGELETTGWSISGYSTFYKGDSWYADGVLTYGSNQYDIRRNIAFSLATPGGTPSAVNQVNTASPDGSQFSASFTGGRDFQRGAWSVGPYARWQYTTVDFEGYTETVSNPGTPGQGLTLTVNDREIKSMQGVLGGKASFTMSTAWGILIPHFQFEYVREFKDDPDALTSTLVFDPTGTQIAVSGSEIDQSFMNLGLGLSAVFTNGRSAFLYYEKLLGQQGTSKDSIAIGIRIEF